MEMVLPPLSRKKIHPAGQKQIKHFCPRAKALGQKCFICFWPLGGIYFMLMGGKTISTRLNYIEITHFLSLYLSTEKRLFFFSSQFLYYFGSCCRIFSLLWESLHFLSSNTQFRGQLGWTQCCHVHLLLKRLHGSIAIFQV